MSGITALSVARAGITAALNSATPSGSSSGRYEVVEVDVGNSRWAIRSSWYDTVFLSAFDDWSWRRLDCFPAPWEDPRILALLERLAEQRRQDEPPYEIPPVIEPPGGDSVVVELILEVERRPGEFADGDVGRNLLVEEIRAQRARW